VIVGVDFSRSSRRAVEVALAIGASANAPVRLVHVWNASHLGGPGPILPQIENIIAEQKRLLEVELKKWADEVASEGADVSCAVYEGVASRLLPDVARESHAGLLVVGRRGSADLAHVLLGSVSERVVRLSECPVLVVPDREEAKGTPARMMVGTDLSDTSKRAYEVAISLCERLGVPKGIVVAHVRPGDRELFLQNWSELVQRDSYPYDDAALKRWAAVPESKDLPVKVHVVEGSPEEGLLKLARQDGCDWLVLGLQGRSALASFLMGSTTDRILKLADRPILVVPANSPPLGEVTD
jgi:nucleotide-binding universal stress UspA family protein